MYGDDDLSSSSRTMDQATEAFGLQLMLTSMLCH